MKQDSKIHLLVSYLSQNPEFDSLVIQGDTISYGGRTINLEGFDIEKFLSESNRLINDMPNLEIEHVFNIIKLAK